MSLIAALKFLTSGFSTSGFRTDTNLNPQRWLRKHMRVKDGRERVCIAISIYSTDPSLPSLPSSYTNVFLDQIFHIRIFWRFFFSPNSSRSCSVLIFKFVKTLSSFFLLIFKMLILFLASIFTDVYLKPYHETKLSSNNIL